MSSVTAMRHDLWERRLEEARNVRTVRKAVGFDTVAGSIELPVGVASALLVLEGEGGILFAGDPGEKTADVYGAIAASGHPRFGYLHSVLVEEEFRLNGIGARLLTHVARQFFFDGILHLVVRCPPKDRDWIAPALERKGFGLEHRYVRDGESFYGRDVTGWHLSSS